LCPDEPGAPAGGGDQRELVARLRTVIEAKDAGNAMLRAELEAQPEWYRRLEQLAGVQQCCQHVIRRCRAVTNPNRSSPPTPEWTHKKTATR
jgi:hypothetical protein